MLQGEKDMTDVHEYEPLWGNWYLEKEIGSGGFGTVYKARKEEMGHVFYSAIKHIAIPKNEAEFVERKNLLLAESDDDVEAVIKEEAQSVLREFIVQQAFSGCKNIVQVQDVMSCPSRMVTSGYDVFIRMELLNGISARIDFRQPDEREVIKLGKDICCALKELHAQKYVHRDIKPQNILVSDDGTYKLSDFGTTLKMEHTVTKLDHAGTGDYRAPEVVLDKPAGVNSDLYSLGLVLYVLMNKYRMPSDRMIGKTYPAPENASAGFAEVILKACAYDPKKRYQNADEMLQDLENLEHPVLPEPKLHNKKKHGIVITALVVTLCCLALAFLLWISTVHEHVITILSAKPATCSEDGLSEGEMCQECGTVLTAQTTIPATGHTVVIDPGRAATCTDNGLTEGSHCQTCGAVLTAQTTIPAIGHAPVTVPGYAATYSSTGLTDGSTCSRCGVTLTAQTTIPALRPTTVDQLPLLTVQTTAKNNTSSELETYTGPGRNYYQAGGSNAKIKPGQTVNVYGKCGNWLFVEYETKRSTGETIHRFAYVNASQLTYNGNVTELLSQPVAVTISKQDNTRFVDDPNMIGTNHYYSFTDYNKNARAFARFKDNKGVEWVYLETTGNGSQSVRGFIKKQYIK